MKQRDMIVMDDAAIDTFLSRQRNSTVGRGVVLEDDPALLELVCLQILERYNAPYTPELRRFLDLMMHNRVVVRLDVERTRTWDHRKLGLPAMELGGTTAASTQEM